MQLLTSFATGLLFGLGLIVSGMANPAKVLAFLDITGNWDPSLIFVMGGAVLIGSLLFPIAMRCKNSVLGTEINLPTAMKIDRRLIFGSLTFGIGWGIAGYCPGPALVSVTQGIKPLIFGIAMLIGMLVFTLLEHRKS